MSFDQLCGIAINRLHIGVFDFYKLTPIEFDYALNDWGRQLNQEVQSNYNIARWLARHIWNAQGRVTKRLINDPRDVEKFPWDQKKEQTKGEIINSIKAIFGGMARKRK